MKSCNNLLISGTVFTVPKVTKWTEDDDVERIRFDLRHTEDAGREHKVLTLPVVVQDGCFIEDVFSQGDPVLIIGALEMDRRGLFLRAENISKGRVK